MESVERLVRIADKIYLWQDFSQADYNYFYKYMKQIVPSRYPYPKEDCVSEALLKMLKKYDITKDDGRKKNFLEMMVRREALYAIRDATRYYEWANKDDILVEELLDWTKVEDKMLYDNIIETIESLKPLYSPVEQEIIDLCIIQDYPLTEIAKRNNISEQLVSLMKKRIVERIKKCFDFYQ